MRIGYGWDLHKLIVGRQLILGGIFIPSEKGEEAHSDGDVLIHAVIDSLLGAVAEGDIGSHFPDNDPEYKDISSMLLLERTLPFLKGKRICNIDCTIVLDEPKLRPYIDTIRQNLAKALTTDISNVSIKAKTSEKTAKDVITATAVVLLE
jgi:2-C-methyl-D-erythritol 2,4-cyclodiphosphate synthase